MSDDARTIHRALMDAQLAWASARDLSVDDAGTLADARDNWLAPLHPESERELEAWVVARGEARGKPGPLHGLGSGRVLAINCFDPWRGREAVLAAALPELVPRESRMRLVGERFADAAPTAAEGRVAAAADARVAPAAEAGVAPTAEGPLLLFEGASGGATALWPLLSEPFADVDPRPSAPPERWRAWPGCGLLAEDLRFGPPRFRRLEAGRLLEAALELAARFGRHRFRLAVVYLDAGGRATRRLRREIDWLRMRIGGEVALLATSWQAIGARLPADSAADAHHVARLGARYFEGVPVPRSTASMGGG